MKKVFAIFCLLIFLFSTINLSLSRHFCRGRLAEVKLVMFNEQASCGMDDNSGECVSAGSNCSASESIGKKPCCESELTKISITDNYKPASNSKLTNFQPLFRAVFTNSIFSSEKGYTTPVRNYKAPPDYNSVSLPFIQVFLV